MGGIYRSLKGVDIVHCSSPTIPTENIKSSVPTIKKTTSGKNLEVYEYEELEGGTWVGKTKNGDGITGIDDEDATTIYSVTRKESPLRTNVQPYPRPFVRGKRGSAGRLLFDEMNKYTKKQAQIDIEEQYEAYDPKFKGNPATKTKDD